LNGKESQLDPFLLLAIFPITYMQHSFLGNNTLKNMQIRVSLRNRYKVILHGPPPAC
jgi:hypothetical protein